MRWSVGAVVVLVARVAVADPAELANKGKYQEAIAEATRAVKQQPTDPMPLMQLAYAYVRAGMGEAARRTARAAVQLAPSSADTHSTLAWVLTFDTLGRPYGSDHDRAGALAALAQARALGPKHVPAARARADLLARGSNGVMFDAGCDLAAAAGAWRDARAITDDDDAKLSHAGVLLALGDAAAAEKLVRQVPASRARDGLLVAAIAVGKRGAPAAAKDPAAAGDGIRAALRWLYKLRQYDAARALAGTATLPGPAGGVLSNIARTDKLFPRTEPRWAMVELMRVALDENAATTVFWDAEVARELRPFVRIPAQYRSAVDVPRAAMVDIGVASATLTVTGASPLWHVELDGFGNKTAAYVVLDGGMTKVLGLTEAPAGAGRYALQLVARRELAAAAQLLDWVRSDIANSTQDAAVRFTSVYKLAGPRDADTLVLAATLLLPGRDASAEPALIRCTSTAIEARAACDAALAEGYVAQRQWKLLLAHTDAWMKRTPDPKETPTLRALAQLHLGQTAAAEKLAKQLVARFPDEIRIQRLWITSALARHDVAEAIRRFDPVLRSADRFASNELAWLRVTENLDLKAALKLAQQATTPKSAATSNPLNTLALVEAELGDVNAAKDDEWSSMERRPGGTIEDSDWYTIGRIAEGLGLRDDAIAAYRRIPSAEPDIQYKTSYELAQKRLRALGVK
jgi:tetratricopeptide (TPR) repeat protein